MESSLQKASRKQSAHREGLDRPLVPWLPAPSFRRLPSFSSPEASVGLCPRAFLVIYLLVSFLGSADFSSPSHCLLLGSPTKWSHEGLLREACAAPARPAPPRGDPGSAGLIRPSLQAPVLPFPAAPVPGGVQGPPLLLEEPRESWAAPSWHGLHGEEPRAVGGRAKSWGADRRPALGPGCQRAGCWPAGGASQDNSALRSDLERQIPYCITKV